MFQKLIDLFERFVVAYEKDVEHTVTSRGRIAEVSEKLGEKVAELGDAIKEETAPPIAAAAPTDRDVLKADLRAGKVDYKDAAQTTTLQKLWLEMKKTTAAPAAPPRVYTAEEVRARGIEMAGIVGKEKVQVVFNSFDAVKFTEIPKEKYPEAMAALEALK